jgi:S1-C subfamily serine protease
LQHAFEKGMVHRDIKAHNLILARDGDKHVVKVLDFGLAKATREKKGTGHEATGLGMTTETPDLTGAGMMVGTPDYMAPEQTLEAGTADIRADIYSLGCTLFFLLTGRPPFQAKDLLELLEAHQARKAEPLHQIRAEVPAELAAVVARMMAKDPAQRYQRPVEVAQALAPFVNAAVKPPIEKRRKRAGAGSSGSVGVKVSRRWLFGIGAVVTVLLALNGWIIWLAINHPPTPEAGTIARRTLHSLAWIHVYSDADQDMGNLISTGTGSLIDKKRKLLLTSYHVLSGRKAAQVFFAQFDKDGREIANQEYYLDKTKVQPIHAKVLEKDSQMDLAVLELDSVPDGVQELRLAAQSPAISQTVHAFGNPWKALNGVLWGYNQGHVRQISRVQTTYQGGQEVDASVVITENPINSGDSGGPLVNDKGELVGVCSAADVEIKVSYFIDVHEIRKMLERIDKRIPPTTKP